MNSTFRPAEFPHDAEKNAHGVRRYLTQMSNRLRQLGVGIGAERLWFYGLLLLGLLIRVEYLREFSFSPLWNIALGPDVQEYHERATEILFGRGLPVLPEIHAPLYSWFLAAVYRLGGGIPAARIIQTLLNFGAWVILYRLLTQLKVRPAARRIFFALAMGLPTLIFHQAELISESLLIPAAAAVLALLYRAEKSSRALWLIAAGATAGVAMLIHALFTAVAVAETAVFLFRRMPRRAGLFAAGTLLAVLPVVAVKSINYHELVGIQQNAGFNIWLGNHAGANGGCVLRPGRRWRNLHRAAEKEAQERGISVDLVWLGRAGTFWLEQPGKALALLGRKAWGIISPNELISGADPGWLVGWTKIVYHGRTLMLPVMLLATGGLILLIRRRETGYLHFYVLAAALTAAQLASVTSGRYRLVMFPALLLFAAEAAAAFNWKKYYVLVLPALAAGMALSEIHSDGGKFEAASLLGEAAFLRGNDAHAERLLRYAAKVVNDPARFENLLGRIAERRGDPAAAFQHYRRAVKSEPQLPEGWMNAGNLFAAAPDSAESARRCYEIAEKLAPFNADVKFNFSLFLLQKNNLVEAKREVDAAIVLAPGRAAAHNIAGVIAMKSQDAAAARKAFARAVKLEPETPGYRVNLQAADKVVFK